MVTLCLWRRNYDIFSVVVVHVAMINIASGTIVIETKIKVSNAMKITQDEFNILVKGNGLYNFKLKN